MAKIFTADTDYYIVAENMDEAVEKYFEERGVYPTTITLFKDSGFVMTESNVVEINVGVLPQLAEDDGAVVSPTPNVFIKEGDQITLIATTSVNYTTFNNWTDGDGNILSTDNPYTYTAGATAVVINANFSA